MTLDDPFVSHESSGLGWVLVLTEFERQYVSQHLQQEDPQDLQDLQDVQDIFSLLLSVAVQTCAGSDEGRAHTLNLNNLVLKYLTTLPE